jgi:hypothetical protein
MSKFNSIISDSVKNTSNLTRVRIKIDPAKWTPKCNVNELEEFVGYILQENEDGSVSVYIPGVDSTESIFNIPMSGVEQHDRYQQLKEIILSCMDNKGVNDPKVIDGIKTSDCIHVLEDWMHHGGFSEREIIDILKDYISESR